jgi:quercetin dioxygenase-like cupin family protein
MKYLIRASVVIGLWSLQPIVMAADQEDVPVPVQSASYHVPLFRNEYVTLLRVYIPAHRTTNYHIHDHDLITVVVEEHPEKSHSQRLGAEPNVPRGAKLGMVDYNAYFTRPVTHRTINPDEIPVHVAGVMMNSEKAYGFTPKARDPASYTQLFDNERARGWRLVLAPGQTAPPITQAAPGVRIIVHGGEIAEIVPGLRDRAMMLRLGDFYWQEPGATRAVRNIGDTPVEYVEIELK